MMRMKQEQIEALAAKWDAQEAPDVEYTQVHEPAADPMVVYSLRLPRAVADQLRAAAERRGMRPAELAREWIAARLAGDHPTNRELADQLEHLAQQLRAS